MVVGATAIRHETGNRRLWSRYAIETAAPVIVVVDQRALYCLIENISLTGVLLRFPGRAPAGDEIRLEAEPVGQLKGRCVWSGGIHMGVSFGLSQGSVDLALRCIVAFATGADRAAAKANSGFAGADSAIAL